MLRFSDIIYGPIHSRRLGTSLGVNLLPRSGKLCSFDCIYCECGWNSDGRTSEKMPSSAAVVAALEESLASFSRNGEKIDTITFAGHGEPTLNPAFPEIMDATVSLRNRYCPCASIAVLSEMGVGIGEVKAKLLNPLATMLLTLAVPAGYIYVGAPLEGVISTALNAASIAWTVTQIASGCYVSGILGGAIMLSSTYLGAQQRTSQLCEEKNRKALDDAKRSLLSEYFSDFD